MSTTPNIDGILVQWGDRLFYPGNRMVRANTPRLRESVADRAARIRSRIEATVARRAPQVMVKVTGGGRGMRAIAAHFRYISKNGRLEIEDEHGDTSRGPDAVRELADEWRFGGTRIDEVSDRREAFNIMLSMPRGVDALAVLRAAREFARAELADHKYVLVLHEHQANPHVHLSVRAESRHGRRLNPRKADLRRWRETFAEKLREWGIDAEATRQATRGVTRNDVPLWRLKAEEGGRERTRRKVDKSGPAVLASRARAAEAWGHIAAALVASGPADRALGEAVARWASSRTMPTSTIDRQVPAPSRAHDGVDLGDRR